MPSRSFWEPMHDSQQRYGYLFRMLEPSALPHGVLLQQACRRARIEVTYTLIENLSIDGRDRLLDYKSPA